MLMMIYLLDENITTVDHNVEVLLQVSKKVTWKYMYTKMEYEN